MGAQHSGGGEKGASEVSDQLYQYNIKLYSLKWLQKWRKACLLVLLESEPFSQMRIPVCAVPARCTYQDKLGVKRESFRTQTKGRGQACLH